MYINVNSRLWNEHVYEISHSSTELRVKMSGSLKIMPFVYKLMENQSK